MIFQRIVLAHFPRLGTGLVVVAVLTAACTSGGGEDLSNVTVPNEPPRSVASSTTATPTTSASTTTSTTSTSVDPVAAVEQAFVDQWYAFVEITTAPDVDNPLIDRHFTGLAEEAILDALSDLLAEGEGIRLPEDPAKFEPRIVETRRISDTEFMVFECTVQGLVLFDRASGAVLDDAMANLEFRNRMVAEGGRWKVANTVRLEPGEPGCDEL